MTVQTKNDDAPSYLRAVRHFSGTKGERIEEQTLVNVKTNTPMTEEERKSMGIEEPLVRYVGVVSSITPVVSPTPEGELGGTTLMTDVRFGIDATSAQQALNNFRDSVERMDEQMRRQQQLAMEELMKEEQNKIVVPDAEEAQAINNLKLIRPND